MRKVWLLVFFLLNVLRLRMFKMAVVALVSSVGAPTELGTNINHINQIVITFLKPSELGYFKWPSSVRTTKIEEIQLTIYEKCIWQDLIFGRWEICFWKMRFRKMRFWTMRFWTMRFRKKTVLENTSSGNMSQRSQITRIGCSFSGTGCL